MLDHVALEVSTSSAARPSTRLRWRRSGSSLVMEPLPRRGPASAATRRRAQALLLGDGARPPAGQRRPRLLRRRPTATPSTPSTPPPSPPAAPTTAPPARARSTTPATTAASSSTPTATTSRPSATSRPPSRTSASPAAGTRRRGRPAGRPRRSPGRATSPVTITWSPAAITSRRSQAIQTRASSIAGTPARSLQATPAHFSATGALVAKERAIGSWPLCRTLIAEAVGGLDGEQGAGAAVEAGEHQHRLDRERADGVGGRPGGSVGAAGGDDRDARRQVRHRGAEAWLGRAAASSEDRDRLQTI